MALTRCPACRRHIRLEEATCPFCESSARAAEPPVPGAGRRLKRAAMYAFGAAAVSGLAGCPAYGLPEERFDASPSFDAGADAAMAEEDAGLLADAGVDAGLLGVDAGGLDAGGEDAGALVDAGPLADAGPERDAGADAGVDAGLDTDAGRDAGNIVPPYGTPALLELV